MSYVPSRHTQRKWLKAIGDTTDLISQFPKSVEQWRPLVTKYANGIPVSFLLAWIQKESDGNPCSWTSLRESGVFQLMYPDNLNTAGVTEPQLRAACVGNTQQIARSLTPAEAEVQISSGIRYVRAMMAAARRKLAAAGANWSENSPSFWMMVKLQHAYPAPTAGWLAAATAKYGRPPRNWNEFRSAISGYASVLDNAQWVGARATSDGGSAVLPVLFLGAGAALLYYLWERH